MSHLRLNLTFLLQQRGITATALARTTGVQQPTLHRILKGTSADPRSATLQPLADYFGVTLDDLYHRDLTTGTAALLQVSVREGPNIKGLVPLLTSVQAGEWCDISQSFQREDAKTWLPCPVKHGPRTFCLTVEGESMKNPGAKPSYEPGDVIFIGYPDSQIICVLALAFAFTPLSAKQPRSTVERHAFVREYACPATGKHRLPCPGYHIDHVIPLCAGGPDRRSNMQWLTIDDHKVKTRRDIRACRLK